jgi:hypothetical protein
VFGAVALMVMDGAVPAVSVGAVQVTVSETTLHVQPVPEALIAGVAGLEGVGHADAVGDVGAAVVHGERVADGRADQDVRRRALRDREVGVADDGEQQAAAVVGVGEGAAAASTDTCTAG